jgi:hypothetical protein
MCLELKKCCQQLVIDGISDKHFSKMKSKKIINCLTVQDVVRVQILLVLLEDGLEVGSTIANLVVAVKLTPGQKNLFQRKNNYF